MDVRIDLTIEPGRHELRVTQGAFGGVIGEPLVIEVLAD